ncbi:MAG: 3-hydroxyacyl-CoA dehydrogenase family protein [Pirellulales bacterium]|nr:3-hydroxyacyl-CoA dehydrogenase family protein [Pirellulales bacterium]
MQTRTIGVAGLGLLGRGICASFLGHGFRVIAFTRRRETHETARRYIDQAIRDLVERAGFPAELTARWGERYEAVENWEPFAGCEFVIESVAEDPGAKGDVFDALEALVGPEVPIASNTSALPISRLQRDRKHPQRFLGMHWAEPAHCTRFLELVRGEQTSDAALEAAAELGRAIGKEPALVEKDVPGFIVNRLGYAVYREALNILEMGVADAETIDRAFRNAAGVWASLCGPLRWIDISGGPALYAKAMRGVLPTLSNATEVPKPLEELAESDARGTANGRGFYEYTEEESRRWDELLREHAWEIRALLNKFFPL